METAQRVLRPAAGGKVEGLVGGADPFESVQEAVRQGAFDEIIDLDAPQAHVEVAAARPHPARRRAWACP